jgi:transposase
LAGVLHRAGRRGHRSLAWRDVVRHRFNRGGGRQLNRALHDILLTRWRACPRTRAYITRRRAEGKTDAEIRRCLKRYIAREFYRCLNTAMAT